MIMIVNIWAPFQLGWGGGGFKSLPVSATETSPGLGTNHVGCLVASQGIYCVQRSEPTGVGDGTRRPDEYL